MKSLKRVAGHSEAAAVNACRLLINRFFCSSPLLQTCTVPWLIDGSCLAPLFPISVPNWEKRKCDVRIWFTGSGCTQITYHFANGELPWLDRTCPWFNQQLLENFVQVRGIVGYGDFAKSDTVRGCEWCAFGFRNLQRDRKRGSVRQEAISRHDRWQVAIRKR